MDKAKQEKLEKGGWAVGSAAEFLELSQADQEYVDIKLALARQLRRLREETGLRQADLAALRETSQPRIATLEKGGETVSIDAQIKALLAGGASRADVASAIAESV